MVFHDRKGDILKTLTLSDYRRYKGSFWRAHRQDMENHRNGKSTSLEYGTFRFGVGLGERDFTPGRLKRAR